MRTRLGRSSATTQVPPGSPRRRRAPLLRTLALLVTALLVAAGTALIPQTAATADAAVFGALGAKWTRTAEGPQKYPNLQVTPDVPIRMSDGTVLRGNLIRPTDARGRVVDKKLPTVVNMTPYTKMVSALAAEVLSFPVLVPQLIALLNAINLQGTVLSGYNDLVGSLKSGFGENFSYDTKLVRSGYNMLVVDVRGTGFSQGTWQVFGPRERKDTLEVVNWAKRQRWSDGKIGMAGASYSAINQLQVASDSPGAVDAIFPVVPGADLLRDVVAPGGGVGFGFLSAWLAMVNTTKMIPNVASMLNGTFDWKWLGDRAKDPLTFIDVMLQALTVQHPDQASGKTRDLLTEGTAYRTSLNTDLGKITTPTFAIGGWNDLFTNSEARLLTDLTQLPDSKKKLIMDDGYHITTGAQFGTPGNPPKMNVLSRAWYDRWLKGIDNGIDRYSPATLASMPRDNYLQGQTFPLPGYTHQRQYLSGRPSGSVHTPVAGDGSLSSVTPSARTTRLVQPGLSNLCGKDGAQGAAGITALFDFCGRDNRLAEVAAQTFTTAPVKKLTRISGWPGVHLLQRVAATDGYWHVTVNVVSPDGRSQVISMGQLMVSLREVDRSRSQFAANGDLVDPFLFLSLDHYRPVRPGQILPVNIPMTPTQAALHPGDRLRIDIYSLNAPKAVPLGPEMWASKFGPQYIEIDPKNPSWVTVPVDRKLR
ncbi:putative hydrolase [Gordonia hirsuta DSM 44140 = NBRC 16056]|uniref:Putative hydrolase n=1 Tax=Gordonia hirsuta DSM 44140 = NBRC 16056 TaxID=1121927 RepID=L7L476_9ACTN|nr:CocE/NonD family hydrolase [Gordonia hirsuta]GAC55945.1 putative hydrolase [Gordonia hirsuta DSM 44140 = NBRC 16056]